MKIVGGLFCATLLISIPGCFSANKVKSDLGSEKIPSNPILLGQQGSYSSVTSYKFKFREFREIKLSNGLKIFFIHDNTLPRLSLTMLVKTGSLQEPESFGGLNALTANLLEHGTSQRDSSKIADEFGQLGTSIEISPGYDFSTIYSDSLSLHSNKLLPLFAEVVMKPAFKEVEIKRIKSQVLSGIAKKVDNPSGFADEKMDEFLFGNHPYSRDPNGSLESIQKISKQDIMKHYLNYYRPNNASLAVVGHFSDEYEKLVIQTFSKWTKKNIPENKTSQAPSINKLEVRLYVKKGLQQAQIRLSQIGIERTNPDYLTLKLGNEILGGGFASRLNQKVRDDLGLTYSISSYFDSKKEKGSFDISTFSKNETAGSAFEETLKVVSEYIRSGVSGTEVQAGKNLLIGQFPSSIETADRLATSLLVLDYYGIPFDYLENYNDSIRGISAGKIEEAMKQYLEPQKFKAVIYGNESIIPQFKKYQPDIIYIP